MKLILISLLIASFAASSVASAQTNLIFQRPDLTEFQAEIMQREADLRMLEEELSTKKWTALGTVAATIAISTLSFIGFRRTPIRGAINEFWRASGFRKTLTGVGVVGTGMTVHLSWQDYQEIKHRIAMARARLQYAQETVRALSTGEFAPSTDKCTLDDLLKPTPEV